MNIRKVFSDSNLLAISTGLIYLWFGILKFFPQLSPAEKLAMDTINIISFGLIPAYVSILLLATWECVVGILLILNFYRKQASLFALFHILFTFFPLFLFYDLSFSSPPIGFSLLGQYIFKNVLIVAALIVIYRKSTKRVSPF